MLAAGARHLHGSNGGSSSSSGHLRFSPHAVGATVLAARPCSPHSSSRSVRLPIQAAGSYKGPAR